MEKSIGDIIAHLKTLNPEVTAKSHKRDLKKTLEQMARKGFVFNEKTYALTKRLCDGEGLMLCGPVGAGKSFFFYAAGIPGLSIQHARGQGMDALNYALNSWRDEDIVIDDVGSSDNSVNEFGTIHNLLSYVIDQRLECDGLTHFTTNLTPEQLLATYGQRIVDRMTEMCTRVVIEGQSLRKPGAPKKYNWSIDFYKGKPRKACLKCNHYNRDTNRCLKGIENEPEMFVRPGYGPEPRCREFSN